jgi:Endosomal/lysosomal potassium channel TMEM175
MERENTSLPSGEPGSIEPHTDHVPLTEQTVTREQRIQRITHVLGDIRPTPGSNVTRIYGLSDCVIAVAFTLVIVNLRLPPEGLNESQLQHFIIDNMLASQIPFYLATYIIVASSWISHYRIMTYLKRSSSLFIILNVLFLASIVFLPIPVAFFYRYGNPFRHRYRFLQRLASRSRLSLFLRPGLVPSPHLLPPPSAIRRPGRNRPHVFDYRQHDCGGDHLLDRHHYERPAVQQRAIAFGCAGCGAGRIAGVRL